MSGSEQTIRSYDVLRKLLRAGSEQIGQMIDYRGASLFNPEFFCDIQAIKD